MVPLESAKRVTVKGVARAAGVSTQTVSRVVNDYAFVSEKNSPTGG